MDTQQLSKLYADGTIEEQEGVEEQEGDIEEQEGGIKEEEEEYGLKIHEDGIKEEKGGKEIETNDEYRVFNPVNRKKRAFCKNKNKKSSSRTMLVLKNQFSALEELDGECAEEISKLEGCWENWK